MSGHSLNYSVRPAKHIERILISQSIRKLEKFHKVNSYRYVGFGARFFSDFKLFHKDHGIKSMLSIERDSNNKERFEYNRPFSFINMEFGEAKSILPTIEWQSPTILWLDYICPLNHDVLADTSTFINSSISGSLIIITVNAESNSLNDNAKSRVEMLTSAVGEKKVRLGLKNADLNKNGVPLEYAKIITDHINSTLNARSGKLPPTRKMKFKQVFNFKYADGAQMLTIGGIVIHESEEEKYSDCHFENLLHTRTSPEEFYEIDMPALTMKEVMHLEAFSPCEEIQSIPSKGISQKEIESFMKFYQYYPKFMPVDS